MQYKVIDFHTHPFLSEKYNICKHLEYCNMSFESTKDIMNDLGVVHICGSVISSQRSNSYANEWQKIRDWNDQALQLKEKYGDFYTPGFHIHPNYVDESLKEIDRMSTLGIRLIGEIVPYLSNYDKYVSDGMFEIIKYATEKNMIISIHPTNDDDLDAFIEHFPETKIVVAHPGEYAQVLRHIKRIKRCKNCYLDLSGTGISRYGMVKRVVDEVGASRILYGSDYPVCNSGAFLGGVFFDKLLAEEEKQAIFYGNAKRLLEL